MCTAISLFSESLYFGRTLDFDFTYPCQVVITPRSFPLRLLREETLYRHYAMIGMAYLRDSFPLYYDGMNEEGLCIAGLNFEGNAYYSKEKAGSVNIASFELIPYLLGACASVREVRVKLYNMNITDDRFSPDLPSAQLHYLIADRYEAITLEITDRGLQVYDNPVGVLTNNPPFAYQVNNLTNYLNVSPYPAENRFSESINLQEYSRGMGALGLPGDFSSMSRFVRAAFMKLNSVPEIGEKKNLSRFFSLMDTVSVPKGACRIEGDRFEETLYTCCMSTEHGVYYYKTKENRRITSVDMKRVDRRGGSLICYPLKREEDIFLQN